jgi:hypothetical protein
MTDSSNVYTLYILKIVISDKYNYYFNKSKDNFMNYIELLKISNVDYNYNIYEYKYYKPGQKDILTNYINSLTTITQDDINKHNDVGDIILRLNIYNDYYNEKDTKYTESLIMLNDTYNENLNNKLSELKLDNIINNKQHKTPSSPVKYFFEDPRMVKFKNQDTVLTTINKDIENNKKKFIKSKYSKYKYLLIILDELNYIDLINVNKIDNDNIYMFIDDNDNYKEFNIRIIPIYGNVDEDDMTDMYFENKEEMDEYLKPFLNPVNNLEKYIEVELNKYMELKYEINTNVEDRIQSKDLINDIVLFIQIDNNVSNRNMISRALINVGLKKKRYSGGIYYYGLKQKNSRNSDMMLKYRELERIRELKEDINKPDWLCKEYNVTGLDDKSLYTLNAPKPDKAYDFPLTNLPSYKIEPELIIKNGLEKLDKEFKIPSVRNIKSSSNDIRKPVAI